MSTANLVTRLGLDCPIILAPLSGGPSTPELTAAVSNGGGLGTLGAAYFEPTDLSLAIRKLKSLTLRSFAVNLFVPAPEPRFDSERLRTAIEATREFRDALGLPEPKLAPPYAPDFDKQMAVVLEEKPAVFSFVFGLMAPEIIRECRARGILVIGTATSLDEARALENSGVDAVVAQGFEAGGHRGMFTPDVEDPRIGTLELTRSCVKALRIPVIASGGIMDGKGISAALAAGAQAAALGTAFLACDESGTSKPYREALLRQDRPQTNVTRAFSGRWARGLENAFMRKLAGRDELLLPFPAQNKFTRDIRAAATQKERPEFLSLWAGTGVDSIRAMKADDLLAQLRAELRACRS